MKAEKSNLVLLDFYLLENIFRVSDGTFDSNDQMKEEVEVSFDLYEIDIDFGHKDVDENNFEVFMNLKINADGLLPGYSIDCSGVGQFFLEKPEDEKNLKVYKNLKLYSTVNIVLNQLRNIVSMQTSFGPYGNYILPAIDITKLFRDKIEQQKNKKSAEQK